MRPIRIGTRDSQLAVWQATLVQNLLKEEGVASELVYIKSEGDIDTVTPLYALGVTGIFTKTLDAALLNNRIDIAVHSMKDVPTQLAQGIQQAAVLERASWKDVLVLHPGLSERDTRFELEFVLFDLQGSKKKELKWKLPLRSHIDNPSQPEDVVIATSSIRRIAQWRHQYKQHRIENIRGNVNTRLRKLAESNWHGAIFAAAGLERIGLRPENSVDLDWMLPAPAQGAIIIMCREGDDEALKSCQTLNHEATALCTKLEKDFLRVLMGGCSTPISALAQIENNQVYFQGSICSVDGEDLVPVSIRKAVTDAALLGEKAAYSILTDDRAQRIMQIVRHERR